MLTPMQSQRYAYLVRDFTKDEFYAYYKHLGEGGTVEDFFESVAKHGTGDQKPHGSWANLSVGGKTVEGTTITSLIDKLSEKKTPGFTIDIRTKQSPKNGFIASDKGAEKVLEWAPLKASRSKLRSALRDFVEVHGELLDGKGSFMGGWVEKGKLYLDVSRRYSSRSEGVQAGFRNKQKAIYDVINDSYIYMKDEVDERTNKARTGGDSETSQGDERGREGRLRGRNLGGDTGQPVKFPHICLGRYTIQKHRDGEHDQATHGNWAGDRYPEDSVKGARDGAKEYAFKKGLKTDETIDYTKVVANRERASKIADLYENLPKMDKNAVDEYEALASEVDEQFDFMTKTLGVKVEFVAEDPYKTSKEMLADVSKGNLKVLSTASTGAHPLFTNSQNDKFRAVHDFFGHAATGRGFGQDGEEAAWVHHSQMFTQKARAALTTETRGQNSFFNNRGKQFADQKVALLPDEFWQVPASFQKFKIIRFAPGLKPVFKHGEGDQSPHGNWARNQGFSQEEADRIENMRDLGPSLEDLDRLVAGEEISNDEMDEFVRNDSSLFESAVKEGDISAEQMAANTLANLQEEFPTHEYTEQEKNQILEDAQDTLIQNYIDNNTEDITTLIADTKGYGGNADDLVVFFDEVYSVETTGIGRDGLSHTLSSSINSVRMSDYDMGAIQVIGEVINEDGDNVSEIQRTFSKDGEGGWEVEHNFFMIRDENYRSTGFGKEFLRQSEDWYTARGISSLKVGTEAEGAVYWARRGFDFDEKANTDNFRSLSRAFSGDNPEFVSLMNRAVNDYDSISTFFSSVKPMTTPGFPTPAEFALIGYTEGATSWLGSNSMWGVRLKYRKGMSAEARDLITPSGAEKPIDRDGDGLVFDGTAREKPAPRN